MIVYTVLIILCVISMLMETYEMEFSVGSYRVKASTISKIVLSVYILLIGIFRSPFLGVDTGNYKEYYFDVAISQGLHRRFSFGSDIGFHLLTYLITRFTHNYYIYRVVVYILTFILESLVIGKKSTNIGLSYLAFLAFGFLDFDFQLLRQALAVSLCFCGLDLIEKRKIVGSLILTFCAFWIHKTAIIFLLLYFSIQEARSWKGLAKKWIMLAGAFFVGAIGLNLLLSIYTLNDYSDTINAGQGKGLLIYIIVLMALVYCSRSFERKDWSSETNCSYNIGFCAIPLQIIALFFALFTRAVMYPLIFCTLLVPNSTSELTHKNKVTFSCIYLILFVALTIFRVNGESTIVPYQSVFRYY